MQDFDILLNRFYGIFKNGKFNKMPHQQPFRHHSFGLVPVSRAKVRAKTDEDEKPECLAMSTIFACGYSDISRFASLMR